MRAGIQSSSSRALGYETALGLRRAQGLEVAVRLGPGRLFLLVGLEAVSPEELGWVEVGRLAWRRHLEWSRKGALEPAQTGRPPLTEASCEMPPGCGEADG